jgi:hypothetical protein
MTMLLNAYTVYDNKALTYNVPFFTSTDGSAVRMFADLANDTNTQIGRHPSDYSLFFIGGYDDSKGALLPESPLRHVADATSLLKLAPTPLFERGAA